MDSEVAMFYIYINICTETGLDSQQRTGSITLETGYKTKSQAPNLQLCDPAPTADEVTTRWSPSTAQAPE